MRECQRTRGTRGARRGGERTGYGVSRADEWGFFLLMTLVPTKMSEAAAPPPRIGKTWPKRSVPLSACAVARMIAS